MVGIHHVVAYVVVGVTLAAALAGGVAYRRGGAGAAVSHLLALAQTVVIAQVALGLLLLSGKHRARDDLHYLYGTLSLAALLAPWVYAPREPRRRLAWFAGATALACALAVRAYVSAT